MMVAVRFFALLSKNRTSSVFPPLPDAALPVYTVLVPLFRETAVLEQLIRGLRKLRYPATSSTSSSSSRSATR